MHPVIVRAVQPSLVVDDLMLYLVVVVGVFVCCFAMRSEIRDPAESDPLRVLKVSVGALS